MKGAMAGKTIGKAVRPQSMAAAVAVLVLMTAGCGGSGGGSAPAAVSGPASVSAAPSGASFTLTGDSYGLQNATYLSAASTGAVMVLRAAIASGMTDPDYRTVCRIDIADAGAISAGTAYSLGAGERPFPGTICFFNGHQSTRLRTAGGSVAFDSFGKGAGDKISGAFAAVVVDENDAASPSYRISARFAFIAEAAAPIAPAPVPVPPAAAQLYGAHCAPCHSLGSFDTAPGRGPELALKGGELDALFTGGTAGHQAITLDDGEISALKVLLNRY